jgi:hypothetical protein
MEEEIKKPRNARSKSPFRTARRAESPLRKRQQTGVRSSSRRLATPIGSDRELDDLSKLHESEINIFQQLCIDKHDETAAIEILLDSPNPFAMSASAVNGCGPRVRFSENKRADSIEQQATFSTYSGSTERGAGVSSSTEKGIHSLSTDSSGSGSRSLSRKKASSTEMKRTFLDRFFFKLPKLSLQKGIDPSGFPSVDPIDSTNENNPPLLENPPISKPEKHDQYLRMQSARRIFDESFRSPLFDGWKDATTRTKNDPIALSERSDSISYVSSLSESRATASIRKTREFQRHPSLGIESIQDLRMCLKEMETQLARASNEGQSVSRHKLMTALFTVADSLENSDEVTHLNEGIRSTPDNQSDAMSRPSMEGSMNDDHDEQNSGFSSDYDDEFTQESTAFEEDDSGDADMANDESSPFNIMSFFGVDDENQRVVGQVLDDLLWGDFVSTRKEHRSKRQSARTKSATPDQSNQLSHAKSRKIALQGKDYIEPLRSNDRNQVVNGQTPRSWWRNNSSFEPQVCTAKDNDDNEEEEVEEESISSSTEFPSYLPSSITVKKKAKLPSPTSFPRVASKCSTVAMHHQPQLVQTESHVGFEMGTLPHRTKLV